VNILFVNYGDFKTNSLNHIAGFANALCAAGHACVVAVPSGPETISAICEPLFIPTTYAAALAKPGIFPDARPADIIHAWTPREGVRKFVLAYQRLLTTPARVIIHLEDNERYLIEAYTGKPFSELRTASPHDTDGWLVDGLPHPLRHESFLRVADGITHIVDRLKEHVPAGIPTQLLPPPVDFNLYRPAAPDAALRLELGLRSEEKIIVFTGSNTFANEPEMRELYLAVALLNQRGTPTRLIRTGFNSPTFLASLAFDYHAIVLDLGFVEKSKLPQLLALADVLVQPGRAGAFNDFRLPSKLPEFLAAGKPVVLPPTNLALLMQDGREAVFLKTGAPEEIAATCQRLFTDPKLCATLGKNAAAFARRHFDSAANTRALAAFYDAALARPAANDWSLTSDPVTSETELLTARLQALAPATLAPEFDHLALLLRDLELSLDATRGLQARELAAKSSALAEAQRHYELTAQHARNLELNTLEAQRLSRDHIGQLEAGHRQTETHASNLARTLAAAEVSLAQVTAARDQTTAHAANLETALTQTRRDADAHAARLEAAHAATRRHAANLEKTITDTRHHADAHAAQLEAAHAATRHHAANLEKALDTLRSQFARSETQRHQAETLLTSARKQMTALDLEIDRLEGVRGQLHNQIDFAHHQINELRAQGAALAESSAQAIAQVGERLRDQLATIRQREDVIRQRDEKIRHLQSTFSWRVTAPLRSLRRKFLDPRRPAAPLAPADSSPLPQPELPALPTHLTAFHAPAQRALPYSVDYPNRWGFAPRKLSLRGWCFADDGTSLKHLRAFINGRSYPGTYGLKRMDVLASVRDRPQAEYCGWKVEVELRDGDTHIVLEVGDHEGRWQVFFKNDLNVGAGFDVAELTSYERWVTTYDTLTNDRLSAQRESSRHLPRRPLISVLVPVYNTPEKWLTKAIASVGEQTYSNWELCLADDASTAPHVRPLLEHYAAADPRIKVCFREKNGHISAASNSALALATGDFIALLDHDDELTPHALYEIAMAHNADPTTDFFYSDEDKIDEEGHRHEPYFKPDFLPDLFLAQNYTSHLTVYRASLMRKAGGFRVGYEGSQDWDLALRVVSLMPDHSKIRHIPKILYHWRAIPGSTALLSSEKNYPVKAAHKALTDHFARLKQPVELIPVPGDHWRVKYPLPAQPPLVSLLIPTRNGLKFLQRCVDSILEKTTYPNYEILIVDNGSDDPATLDYLKAVAVKKSVRVVPFNAPFNYSAINNFAAKQANGTVLGLLNNDLEVIHADWLHEMVAQALRPQIGCVGAMLYYPNDTVQHAGVIIGLGGVAGHAFRDFPRNTEGVFNRARLVQNYGAVTAACLVIRKEVFDQVGGLDEKSLAVAFNDVDFCLKVRAAGYLNLWTPFAELYHHESASRGVEDTPEKHERFRGEVETMMKRWEKELKHDPAYNPNLTLELTDFTLAAPPRLWAP
jgi:glycosyltransferase involved in cell wall biosynthesis